MRRWLALSLVAVACAARPALADEPSKPAAPAPTPAPQAPNEAKKDFGGPMLRIFGVYFIGVGVLWLTVGTIRYLRANAEWGDQMDRLRAEVGLHACKGHSTPTCTAIRLALDDRTDAKNTIVSGAIWTAVTTGATIALIANAPKGKAFSFDAGPTPERARACEGAAPGRCDSSDQVCAPRASPGFQQCVMREGDDPLVACPHGFTERSVFYRDAIDTRACAACTCGPPEGSKCSSLVSLFTDDSCSMALASNNVDETTSMCVNVVPGSPLGSKSATPPAYTPGACVPSGGEVTGSLEPTEPVTFCCLPRS